jgi:hypothetical protein
MVAALVTAVTPQAVKLVTPTVHGPYNGRQRWFSNPGWSYKPVSFRITAKGWFARWRKNIGPGKIVTYERIDIHIRDSTGNYVGQNSKFKITLVITRSHDAGRKPSSATRKIKGRNNEAERTFVNGNPHSAQRFVTHFISTEVVRFRVSRLARGIVEY